MTVQLANFKSSSLTVCIFLQEIATPKPEEPNLGFVGTAFMYMFIKA